ncbi:MAG: GGDEF domain-containing protein [bacterium]|nr:GGDEF domain-containing protein [bacterium]
MKVSTVMSKKVATVTPRTTLVTVVRRMSGKKISCVIVQDREKALGIISERDIVRHLAANGGSLEGITAGQAMSSPVQTLYADTTLDRAVTLMTEKGFRRFPIINRRRKLIGVVTQSDVLQAFVREIEIAHEKMKDLAIRDCLTGMFNRRLFMTTLEKEYYRSKRYGTALSLIMVDLDDFKRVNDEHGHQYGDQVLKTVAEVIKRRIRDMDIAARFGGEEFIVLAPGTEILPACRLAERLREGIAETGTTASLGVACFPNNSSRFPDDLIRLADMALYRAKKSGKNQVVSWDKEMMENNNVT